MVNDRRSKTQLVGFMARQSWLNCNRQRGVAGAGEKKLGVIRGEKKEEQLETGGRSGVLLVRCVGGPGVSCCAKCQKRERGGLRGNPKGEQTGAAQRERETDGRRGEASSNSPHQALASGLATSCCCHVPAAPLEACPKHP